MENLLLLWLPKMGCPLSRTWTGASTSSLPSAQSRSSTISVRTSYLPLTSAPLRTPVTRIRERRLRGRTAGQHAHLSNIGCWTMRNYFLASCREGECRNCVKRVRGSLAGYVHQLADLTVLASGVPLLRMMCTPQLAG